MKPLWLVAVAGALALLPVAAFAADDPGARCDSLAGLPGDADIGAAPGVAFDEIDPAAAGPACRAAIAAHPDVARYVFELARVERSAGDIAGAVGDYEKAGGMGSGAAFFGLGDLYENGQGVDQDYARAADAYRKAADLGSVVAMGALAYLYDFGLVGGNDGAAEAAKLYERQIAAGNDDSARINLAVLLEGGRASVAADPARAEALLRTASGSADAGTAAEAKNALAFLLADEKKDLDEAAKLVDEALAEVTDDGTTRASYLDTRGWVRHAAGRDAEALADAEAAVAMDGESAEYVNRLGDIYAALGRRDDAKAAWRKALAMPAPNPYFEPGWDAAAIGRKIAGLE